MAVSSEQAPEESVPDRKKIIINLTVISLVGWFLLTMPAFSQCNFSKPNANKSVTKLVKCLENEEEDPEKDIFNRRQIIFELHKLGKESIPSLIDNILNTAYVPARLDNPRSSHRSVYYNHTGLISAYVIELILSKETLVRKTNDYSIAILGEFSENYVYWDGGIKDSSNKFIKKEELPKIQRIYQEWWEKNEKESICTLRENWKKGARILDGKEYKWQ